MGRKKKGNYNETFKRVKNDKSKKRKKFIKKERKKRIVK